MQRQIKQEPGFYQLTGDIAIEYSLPNIRTDIEARRQWIPPKVDAVLTKLWNKMKELHPERYFDEDANGNPLKLYYYELEIDKQGNIRANIGEMNSKDFYVPDELETNKNIKNEYNLTEGEWKILYYFAEEGKQKAVLNPSAIMKTNDGRDNYIKMSKNTAVPGEIQCTGSSLQPKPGTNPPKIHLIENLLFGMKKKTGLDQNEIGEIKPIGIALWQKSDNGPLHATIIYEANIPNKSAEQLRRHVEEYSRMINRPQVESTVSVDPRNREEVKAFSESLPTDGQRAYMSGLVLERAREYTNTLPGPDKADAPTIITLPNREFAERGER